MVIGGGINGCGIARDLAGRGFSVLLLEKDDLASGTSSASTKMIHGGLRYLEQYEFMLVRKALLEREKLMAIAPHIITPLRLVLPHDPSQRPKWMIRLGLCLYDFLGGRKLLSASRRVDLETEETGGPLKADFTTAFEYADCWVEDARLVVLNAMDAQAYGAEILTRCELTTATKGELGWSLSYRNHTTGTDNEAKAKVIINAAGPYVREVITNRLGIDSSSRIRLVKGSHIVVPALFTHDRAYLFQNPDGRVIFAIPFQSAFTLIGTTDVDVGDTPGVPTASDEEISYLCKAANSYFEKQVTPGDVVWTYSGVRPLFDDGEASAQEVTRDYVLETSKEGDGAPLLSVFGGKITTYRALAEEVASTVCAWLSKPDARWTTSKPLPGGDFSVVDRPKMLQELCKEFAYLSDSMITRLFGSYGTRVRELLAGVGKPKDLGKHFGADLYECEVRYLIANEWARTAYDVVWRRTKQGLFMTPDEIAELDRWMQKSIEH